MSKPIQVTDATFSQEVVQSELPVLVDFWASWCMPCKMVAPLVEEVAKDYAGRLKVAKLDVDSNPQTANQYGIRSIPSLLIFKEGKVVDQIIGVTSKPNLSSKLDKVM